MCRPEHHLRPNIPEYEMKSGEIILIILFIPPLSCMSEFKGECNFECGFYKERTNTNE